MFLVHLLCYHGIRPSMNPLSKGISSLLQVKLMQVVPELFYPLVAECLELIASLLIMQVALAIVAFVVKNVALVNLGALMVLVIIEEHFIPTLEAYSLVTCLRSLCFKQAFMMVELLVDK